MKNRERCPSHHLCCTVHISRQRCLLILCYFYFKSSINMQNSQMIKFLSQELQGREEPRSRPEMKTNPDGFSN